MATLPIYDKTGAEVGSYEIELADLAPRINKQLLHDAVVMYQANRRQGSASTKSRGEVSGSTRKLYRQKGTGNARAGSRRTNIRRGGGHAFAKKPRDFGYRLPKKALRAATRMAVASKILDEQLVVIDELSFAAPKTSEMAGILASLGLGGVTTIIATESLDDNVYKSARNIAAASVSPVSDLNALNVLRPQRMLVTRAALDAFVEKAKGSGDGAGIAEPAGAAAGGSETGEEE